jgi:hypothetical protein
VAKTPNRLAWLGLAGSVLLAVGAFLAGALPGEAPLGRAAHLWGETVGFRLGLLAYLVGLVLLGWAWWRLRPFTLTTRWVLVTGALWALPLLVAPPLGSRDPYSYACHGTIWLDGHDPYTVGPAAGGCPWLESISALWHDTTAPYGAVALLVSAGAVALARAVAASPDAQLLVAVGAVRVAAVLGLGLLAWSVPRLARACAVSPAGAAWLGVATPLVVVHGVSGAHHDALAAGLLVAALALARERALGAGVAVGLAVAVKVTALAGLPFVVLLAGGVRPPCPGPERTEGAWRRRTWRNGAAVLAGAAATFAGLSLVTGIGWVRALTETGSLVQWNSVPTGVGMAVGYTLWGFGWPEAFDSAVAAARVVGLVVLVAVSAWLLLDAWRRRAEVRAVVVRAGWVLAAVVLLGPVVYSWYALPALAVLAASTDDPRVRRWLAVATLVLTALVLPGGLGVPSLTKLPGAFLLVAVLVWLLIRWWRGRRREPRPPGPPPVVAPPAPPPEPAAPVR